MKKRVVDVLRDDQFMFNPAPVYKSTQKSESKINKKQIREKKQLERRAQLVEYMSSDDEMQQNQYNQQEDEDYGQLQEFDQDILGYFQMKGPKIISNTQKIPEQVFNYQIQIFDIGSTHLGAISSIGPNGAYLIVNFTRNKKGFVDQHNLRDRKNVSAANYNIGEYVMCKVTEEPKNNKVQLTLMPAAINENLKFKDIMENMAIQGVAQSFNEFGTTVSFGNQKFTGFINDNKLRLGRTYIFTVKSINQKEKLILLDIIPKQLEITKKNQISKWILNPGTQWQCTLMKEINGGAIVKLDKFGALGYIFSDYLVDGKKMLCTVIGFDEKSRQIYLSSKQEHVERIQYIPEYKIGDNYIGINVNQVLYSGAYLVNVLLNNEGDTKKIKKAKKAKESALGPLCFLHKLNIPDQIQLVDQYNKQCMIKEINYFDHLGIISFAVSQIAQLSDLSVGEIVKGIVKQIILKEDKYSVIVTIKDKFQAVLPQEQMTDYPIAIVPKYKVGSKIKARILTIDTQHNNIILTVKPTLLTDIKLFSTLEEISFGDTIYGFVCKKLDNGILVKFFQNIVGFLPHTSLDGQSESDIQMGQIIKVYVKYVNQEQQKLILSLKKVEIIQKDLKTDKKEKELNSKGEVEIPVKKTNQKKSKIEIGQQVKGVVTAIKSNVVYVNLNDGKFGRIHKAQFECYEDKERLFQLHSEFENLNVGSMINCVVLGESKQEKRQMFDLSCLQNPITFTRESETDANKEVIGIVSHIKVDQIGTIALQICYNYTIYVEGFDCGFEDGEILNDLEERIKIGDPCKVKLVVDQKNNKLKGILMLEANLKKQLPNQDILYTKQIYRVISQHESYIRVQLKNRQFASIDITEANENWKLNPFEHLPLGHWGSCRIIAKENVYWASVRETFLNDKLWIKCLHPIRSTTIAYQKQILSQPFDVRTSIYKKTPLQLGQIVIGYLTGTTYNGSFIKIGYNTTVLVRGYKSDIKYRPVILMLTKLDKLQGTTDIQLLKYKYQDKILKVGDVVDGIITNVKNEKAAIKILGTLLGGEMEKNNAEGADSEEGWWANKLFKIGNQIECLVIGYRKNRKDENVLKLSNIKELIQTEGKKKIQLGAIQQDVLEIYESFENMVKEVQEHAKQLIQEEIKEDKYVNYNNDIDEENGNGNENEDLEEEENQEEEQQEEQQEQEIEEEIDIDQAKLDSRAEYEKSILSNPNSSILWIEFVAFVAENEGIENARQVMERGLRVINFNNESERLNLWTAYLNLEFNFGSEDNLIAIFKRGCQNCNGKKLYQKLINIYRKAGKVDLTVELSRTFTQKFKQSCKSWMEFLQSLIEWQQKHDDENPQYSYKDVLHRALQSLPKPKQVKLFAHYARLQFQHNQIEEAKTTFDSILDKNSQRTDLWSQYVDLATKYCTPQVVRQIFGKALNCNKKPRKMKFLFKKYLEYETAYGNEESTQKVKEQAQKWVQEYMSKGHSQQQQEEEEDSN